jgi:hypothetical protein
LTNIEENLTDDFKKYWDNNTNKLPYIFVFNYIKYISELSWYTEEKHKRKRMYFCIPSTFNLNWLNQFTEELQQAELKIITAMIANNVKYVIVDKDINKKKPIFTIDTNLFEIA